MECSSQVENGLNSQARNKPISHDILHVPAKSSSVISEDRGSGRNGYCMQLFGSKNHYYSEKAHEARHEVGI